jgi:hypothetical protein
VKWRGYLSLNYGQKAILPLSGLKGTSAFKGVNESWSFLRVVVFVNKNWFLNGSINI